MKTKIEHALNTQMSMFFFQFLCKFCYRKNQMEIPMNQDCLFMAGSLCLYGKFVLRGRSWITNGYAELYGTDDLYCVLTGVFLNISDIASKFRIPKPANR